MKRLALIIFTVTAIIPFNQSFGQDYKQTLGQELNAITTAVPFLMIAPDSRSGAMGDVGVALSPDGYSQHWNSSKLAFIDKPMGASLSYTPWLKQLVDDINLAYVSGFYKLDDNQTVGASLRYFSMGNINFTDENGASIGSASPHEYAVDASYNRKLSENFSLGILGRFILSDLTNGSVEGSQSGKSVAMDINGYYTNEMTLSGYDGSWAAGFNMSNIGAKLGYTEEEKNFLPTNLRIGGAMTIELDDYNSITGSIDLNKYLVPTPPLWETDSITGDQVIAYGMDPDVGIVQGMLQSFYDAPAGFEEEVKEIAYSVGVEYWYAKQFAVRAGYFHENEIKGNRKYFTAGVGLKMNVFGLDFSYLIPAGNFNNSPLSNTWRFSLVFDMENL